MGRNECSSSVSSPYNTLSIDWLDPSYSSQGRKTMLIDISLTKDASFNEISLYFVLCAHTLFFSYSKLRYRLKQGPDERKNGGERQEIYEWGQ
jgi:hypothetical protein